MTYLRSRLREPSTWAGLGVLYVSIDAALSSGNWAAAIPGLIGALVAVAKGDIR